MSDAVASLSLKSETEDMMSPTEADMLTDKLGDRRADGQADGKTDR
jgi:hypothetical protein